MKSQKRSELRICPEKNFDCSEVIRNVRDFAAEAGITITRATIQMVQESRTYRHFIARPAMNGQAKRK